MAFKSYSRVLLPCERIRAAARALKKKDFCAVTTHVLLYLTIQNQISMKNIILLFVLVLITTSLLAQSRTAQKYYRQGTNELKKQNYAEAIRILTLSISEEAYANAFYNRAIAYYNLGDTCAFCNDLRNAFYHGDADAGDFYSLSCIYTVESDQITDDIRESYPNAISIKIIYHKCLSDSTIHVMAERNIDVEPQPVIEDLNEETEDIFTLVELMPEFPKEHGSPLEFIARNANYPEEARLKQLQGTVYVGFVVRNDGYVANVVVLRGVHKSLDEEAIRLIKSMPRWQPGKQNGEPVHVRMNIPIRFNL